MNLLFVIYSLLYSYINLQGWPSQRANTLAFMRALTSFRFDRGVGGRLGLGIAAEITESRFDT